LLPRAENYDGVRHFIEYAVPLGALTGIGAAKTIEWVALKSASKAPQLRRFGYIIGWVLISPFFIAWSYAMIRIHPYEIAYFNFLIGGAKGAEEFCNCGVSTDYWGSSYKQGTQWLNANAEYKATVVVPIGGHIVEATQKMWMRRDLNLVVPEQQSDELLDNLLNEVRPGPVYVMYVTRKRAYRGLVREIDSKGKLVFDIEVDGEPILKIMRFNKFGYFF
jgi:hypothetical protein